MRNMLTHPCINKLVDLYLGKNNANNIYKKFIGKSNVPNPGKQRTNVQDPFFNIKGHKKFLGKSNVLIPWKQRIHVQDPFLTLKAFPLTFVFSSSGMVSEMNLPFTNYSFFSSVVCVVLLQAPIQQKWISNLERMYVSSPMGLPAAIEAGDWATLHPDIRGKRGVPSRLSLENKHLMNWPQIKLYFVYRWPRIKLDSVYRCFWSLQGVYSHFH